MPISVTAPKRFAALAAPLRAIVALTLKSESRRVGEVAIVLTDDAALRELNRGWRGIDRATDVISFAYDENEPDAATRPVNGDLVVSMDRVCEQAKRFGVTEGTELARLVIHGALHLGGHDHSQAGERTVMRGREEAAMRAARAVIRGLDAALPKSARAIARTPKHKPAKPMARKKAATR